MFRVARGRHATSSASIGKTARNHFQTEPALLQRPKLSATRDFKDKFERLAEVLGVENAQKHMADVLETALDIALEKKDPKKKLERRIKR